MKLLLRNKIQDKVFILFVILASMISGCKDERGSQASPDRIQDSNAIQRLIIEKIVENNSTSFTIEPTDTIMKLSDGIELVLWKESFLNQNNTVYKGKVRIELSFIQNPAEMLFMNNLPFGGADSVMNLTGIMDFKIFNDSDMPLKLNPTFTTGMRFPVEAQMVGGMAYMHDSSDGSLYTPIHLKKVFKKSVPTDRGREVQLIDRSLMDTTINTENSESGKVKRKYQELIAYELTMKYSGAYYLLHYEVIDAKPVNVSVNVTSEKPIDLSQAKVFLLHTNEKGVGYYFGTEYLGNGKFGVIPTNGANEIRIKDGGINSCFAYAIQNGKCYLGILKRVGLTQQTSFLLNMKEISIGEFLKAIRSMEE